MKHLSFILAFTLITCLVLSCKKKKIAPIAKLMVFNMDVFDTHIRVKPMDTIKNSVIVNHQEGMLEKTTLSASQLPPGVTVAFDTISGIPTFISPFTLITNNTPVGTYTISINAVSTSGTIHSFEPLLIVK